MNLGVRREGTVSDDILETKRLTRTDGRDLFGRASRGLYRKQKNGNLARPFFFSARYRGTRGADHGGGALHVHGRRVRQILR